MVEEGRSIKYPLLREHEVGPLELERQSQGHAARQSFEDQPEAEAKPTFGNGSAPDRSHPELEGSSGIHLPLREIYHE